MVISNGIWVISNGFSKQRLANHVAKLETLTSCLQELLAAGLGIREAGQKRQGWFCLTSSYVQILLY